MALVDTALRGLKPENKPKKYSDGGGLFLLVNPNGSKLWRLAYRFDGKQKTLAFGAYPKVTLADARALRDRAKKAKQAAKREKRLDRSTGPDDEAVDPEEVDRLMGDEDKELSAAELLQLIEKIHQQFENEDITFEEFEERKIELFARLPID